MTIEGLAVMIKHGFDGVDKRFDGVDKRFDGVDKRFDGVDRRLDGMDKRIDKVESTQRNMLGEIHTLQADVKGIKETIGPLRAW